MTRPRRLLPAPFGDSGAEPDGGERRLDGVDRPEVGPVGCWVVVERQQGFSIPDQLFDRLGTLVPELADEAVD